GASLITIHGRTYKQGFADNADWQPIYELKKKLAIPIVGNGDVQDIHDGMNKINNLDGFMIGRSSIGNPWVFSLDTVPAFSEKISTIINHVKYLVELKGEKIAFLEIRKSLLAYVKGLPHASKYRSKLVRVETLQSISDILNEISSQAL
ncbi:MAG: tRNA-dihydrouridine synthase, partial [Patescibacteria group bacterium]